MTLAADELERVCGGIDYTAAREATEASAESSGRRFAGEGALALGVLCSRLAKPRFVTGALGAFIGSVTGYIAGHAYGSDQAVKEQSKR